MSDAYLQHYGVLGMKWGIRRARRKDAARKYKKGTSEYKKAVNDKSRDVAIANKLYSKQSKGANKRVAKMSTSDAIVESMLLGSYGALKFNEAKARGAGTGRAAVESILYGMGNSMTYGLNSTIKYLDNRAARSK
jgi:hypothetical protein